MTAIYLAKIPKQIQGEIYCKERNLEIFSCQSKKVKRQKFYAWRLLELCAKKHGFNVENLHFSKAQNGKWKCNEFEFSLSHSEDYVAIILSNKNVGIDIQKACDLKCDYFAEKILTEQENLEYIKLSENEKQRYLLEKWTQKESIYKMLEMCDLKISKINCSNYKVKTIELILDGDTYYLSYTPFEKNICVNLIKI